MQFNNNGNKYVSIKNLSPNRKTSAEIVSEAKSMLSVNGGRGGRGGVSGGGTSTGMGGGIGTRLVSTRRPITPREPRRQLYGCGAPPGRPPSAFSLRYLQFESRGLPSLEPITKAVRVPRADAIGALEVVGVGHEVNIKNNNSSHSNNISNSNSNSDNNNGCIPNHPVGVAAKPPKLPALLAPPKITGDSMENLTAAGEIVERRPLIGESVSAPGTAIATQHNSIVKGHRLRCLRPDSTNLGSEANGGRADGGGVGGGGDGSFMSGIGGSMPKLTQNTTKNKSALLKSNDLLNQATTESLLEMLKDYAGIKECKEETVNHINGILGELYSRVKGSRGECRSAVLGALYGLVECANFRILLAVARVVLALCVTGSNLTGACKLVFKVARNEVNDSLFADSDVPELLIDGLGRASPIDEPEACIYGYGAVRFLASAAKPKDQHGTNASGKRTLAYRLARHGAVQLMILHLQMLNEAGARAKLSGSPLHALFQLSGALRALAGMPDAGFGADSRFPQINGDNSGQLFHLELAGPHLVRAAEVALGETEVQANIVRTLSILSELEPCCEALADTAARLGILLGPCGEAHGFPEKPLGLLSRLGYTLGNLMARWDSARVQFFNNDVAMEYLLTTIGYYSNQQPNLKNHMGDTVTDVLIKLVRVIANMSVNAEVGHGLGIRAPLGGVLLSLLLAANNIKDRLTAEQEELLLATMGAIHNLSFYHEPVGDSQALTHHPGSMVGRLGDLSGALCKTLAGGPIAARTEASRVLGNMTRSPMARNALVAAGGLRVLVKNLEATDIELVATSCGVLVNLLADWEHRVTFRELRGPMILIDILRCSAISHDWPLAAIICQALWNFLNDSTDVASTLGEELVDSLADDLNQLLDEERIFNNRIPDPLWEQFAPVATDLLERIQSGMSINNSPASSDNDELDESTAGVDVGNPLWGDRFKQWLQQDQN